MQFQTKIKDLDVNVHFENKKNLKNLYLKVVDSENIHIRAGKYFTAFDVKNFIENKQNWIYKKLNELQKISLEDDEFLYFGKIYKKELYYLDDEKSVDKFYKQEASEYINFLVEKFSLKMNLFPTSIKFRKNKRTWGSCNYKNELNFNFLLMKYPLEIIEYVVIHELAHIKHKNHSRNFWNLVEEFCPNYKQREKLFKSFL